MRIRDAGIALVAHMDGCMQLDQGNDIGNSLSSPGVLATKLNTSREDGLRIIELGAGCGLVGIWISTALPDSRILLTDLPEAMDILGLNISQASPTAEGRLEQMVLDWDGDLPEIIRERTFDIILVSDCTYNCDSMPSLVGTIMALVARTPWALIVVSMKIRHESETLFFDLMLKAGILQIEHNSLLLHSRRQNSDKLPQESLEVYVYQPFDWKG